MAVKKCIVLLFITILALVGSTAVWLYLGESPKKSPIRAKQVLVTPVDYNLIV